MRVRLPIANAGNFIFDQPVGNATYEALQLRLTRRFQRGVQQGRGKKRDENELVGGALLFGVGSAFYIGAEQIARATRLLVENTAGAGRTFAKTAAEAKHPQLSVDGLVGSRHLVFQQMQKPLQHDAGREVGQRHIPVGHNVTIGIQVGRVGSFVDDGLPGSCQQAFVGAERRGNPPGVDHTHAQGCAGLIVSPKDATTNRVSLGSKVVLTVESGQRESSESWSGVLRDLGGRLHPLRRKVIAPSETRIRTLLHLIDTEILDEITGGWLRDLADAGRLDGLLFRLVAFPTAAA